MASPKAPESNASQWPKFGGFEELPVNGKEIRVLHLNGIRGDGLDYSMLHKDITVLSYCALSYSWGAPVPAKAMKPIKINQQTVLIRPTLHAALKVLAAQFGFVNIWIDAICIDQANVEERNHQIAMMDDIYRNADIVFVWLGQGDDDTDYALDHISNHNPATPFDSRQFGPSAEKLFQASYWTRRWVIQEFALANDVLIVCGSYVISWHRIRDFINNRVSESNSGPLSTMWQFEQLKPLGGQSGLSLLELMARFKASRCIDRRDRAFALRGIAKDGTLLSPDYKEPVGDVYFRLLSMQPTYGVRPDMIGYRWPHRDSLSLSDYFTLTGEEVLESLASKPSDKLYVVLEYVGEISSVTSIPSADIRSAFSHQVYLKQFPDAQIYGDGNLRHGDSVYMLLTSSSPIQTLHIAYRQDHTISEASGILLLSKDDNWRNMDSYMSCLEMIERVCLHGITKCIKNLTSRTSTERILCHISRAAMILLRLLVYEKEALLLDRYQAATNVAQHACTTECHAVRDSFESKRSPDSYLEIMPMMWNQGGQLDLEVLRKGAEFDVGATENALLHKPTIPRDSSQQIGPDLRNYGRSDLALAAANGLYGWSRLFLHSHDMLDNPKSMEGDKHGAADTVDSNNRTTLSWAVTSGNEDVIRLLLDLSDVHPNISDHQGRTPLMWAIKSGDGNVVKLLLSYNSVDPMLTGRSGRTPLTWAVQAGSTDIVEIMLASGRVEPDAQDVDGMTPLLWAARRGSARMVELVLDTRKVNCNSRDLTGRTALSHAAEQGSESITRMLLAQPDIEPDLMDHERIRPIRWAARKKHPEVFKLLLDTGRVNYNFEYEKA